MSLMVSYYTNITDKLGKEVEFLDVAQSMGSHFKKLTYKIRNAATREEADQYKKEMPAITPSGVFSESKSAKNLVKHSGLCCLDLDEGFDLKYLERIRGQLKQDPYTYSLHVSCSGKGFALYCRIPADPSTHSAHYKWLCKHFKDTYGLGGSDAQDNVNRLRYLCHDPKIYINQDSEVCTETLTDQTPVEILVRDNTPAEMHNLDTDEGRYQFGLMLKERSSDIKYVEGSRNEYIIRLCFLLNELGVDPGYAAGMLQSDFSDLPGHEIIAAVKSSYGSKPEKFGTFEFNEPQEVEISEPPQDEEGWDFDKYRFNPEREIERPIPLVEADGQLLLSAGNLLALTGASKSGKSGIMGAIKAGTMRSDGLGGDFDTCGLKIATNPSGLAVVHLDTEQSEWDYYRGERNVLQRAGRSALPSWYHSYHLLELGPKQRVDFLEKVCERAADQCGGILMILIDGIADFIESVNDEILANQIVQMFRDLGSNYTCGVGTVLHLNPSSEKKSRGHLGSQLERKCESMLTIKKDADDISVVEPQYMRNGGMWSPIQFKYDLDLGYHVFHGSKKEATDEAKRVQLLDQAGRIFSWIQSNDKDSFHKDLVEAIIIDEGCGTSTAKTRIRWMMEHEIIRKTDDLNYKLNTDNDEKRLFF